MKIFKRLSASGASAVLPQDHYRLALAWSAPAPWEVGPGSTLSVTYK